MGIVDLLSIKTTSDLPEVFTALLLGGCGDLTPGEAGRLAALVSEAGKALEPGWGQEEDRQRAREAGFDEHLVKPVGVRELKAVLSS